MRSRSYSSHALRYLQAGITLAVPLTAYLCQAFIWELGRSSTDLRQDMADTEMLTAT
jgi:hypothetical protein